MDADQAAVGGARKRKRSTSSRADEDGVDGEVKCPGPRPRVGQDNILLMRRQWLDLILDGTKTMETRPSNTKHRGNFYLGLGGSVFGRATLTDVVHIKDREQWASLREEHRVEREELEYDKTYGWRLENPVRFEPPIPYEHARGAVTWLKFEEGKPSVEITVEGTDSSLTSTIRVYENSHIESIYELVKYSSTPVVSGAFELFVLTKDSEQRIIGERVLEEETTGRTNNTKITLKEYTKPHKDGGESWTGKIFARELGR